MRQEDILPAQQKMRDLARKLGLDNPDDIFIFQTGEPSNVLNVYVGKKISGSFEQIAGLFKSSTSKEDFLTRATEMGLVRQ